MNERPILPQQMSPLGASANPLGLATQRPTPLTEPERPLLPLIQAAAVVACAVLLLINSVAIGLGLSQLRSVSRSAETANQRVSELIAASSPKPPKYEYKVAAPEDATFEEQLSLLGQSGWELVSARRANVGEAARYECILRRVQYPTAASE